MLSPDGWLDTGDLGYPLDGEIVVTGRAKDLIIVNGRNVWPQDIEWAIEAQKVVKNGDSAAFSIDYRARASGSSSRCWHGSRATRPRPLARDVAGAVREAIAVDCDVVLVPPTMGLPHHLVGQALARPAPRPTIWPASTPPKPAAA